MFLQETIYHQDNLNLMLYDCHALESKVNLDQKYNISYELLTVYQAGAIAFQTILNIEGQKNESITPLSQILLRQAFMFQPMRSEIFKQKQPENIFKASFENISCPDLQLGQDKLWHMMLKNIGQTPLASVWSLFIPFLEKAFLKGLCPFSFYYHLILSPNPDHIIHIAHSILDSPVSYKKGKPSPMTYAIFKDDQFKNEEISKNKVDSLTEIIKSYCEKG